MDVKFKPLTTFSEFTKSKKKKIEESQNISIEVDFWDEAVERISDELLDIEIAGCPRDWKNIVEYCRTKYVILSRPIPAMDIDLVIGHIRDLIYQYHGDAIFNTQGSHYITFKSSELASLALIISELSDVILHRIRLETGVESEPEPEYQETVATVSMSNSYADDELLEKKTPLVVGFRDYSKMQEKKK